MRKVNIHEAKATLSQLVRLKSNRGIKLGGLKGKLAENLLADIAKPLSQGDLDRLFGRVIEP